MSIVATSSVMQGKTALVTGGGGGIGRAACLEFARAGASVAVVDVDETAAQSVVEAIRKDGGAAQFFKADVSRAADVQAFVQGALQTFGRIDAFFNNAGIVGEVAPVAEYSEETFDRVLAINVKGAFLGLKYVLPVMLEQKAGSIINTSSVAGLVGAPEMCAYSASKHAILGLTRTAAGEAARFGVRVNAICPGPIQTPMMRSIEAGSSPDDPQKIRDQVAARNPSRRYGEPEEVARVVVFLASDAASYVNGVAWTIDGGRLAI